MLGGSLLLLFEHFLNFFQGNLPFGKLIAENLVLKFYIDHKSFKCFSTTKSECFVCKSFYLNLFERHPNQMLTEVQVYFTAQFSRCAC